MTELEFTLHEDATEVSFRLIRRDDGQIDRTFEGDVVHVSELLLAEDVGADLHVCDELIDAIQAVVRGDQKLVELGWDTTDVEIRPDTSAIRLSVSAAGGPWTKVPTRELYDALLRLRSFIVTPI